VLDATTGQNGVHQASGFDEVANLTGIILTKMDSSAKGGIIISIKDNFDIPVKYIGLGESLDDLEEFDLNKYLYGLTEGLDIEEHE
jgi:fused signal recognition particle receptor